MPLLYVNQLAALEHLAIDPDLDGRIKHAIDREMTRAELERRASACGRPIATATTCGSTLSSPTS